MKKAVISLILLSISVTLKAQSGSLTPYAMYGIGSLMEQANSASRSMGGVGQGFREGNQVNFLNPASYSGVDSLSFIFDIGMSLQKTKFTEDPQPLTHYEGCSVTKNVADFEYFMAGFRVHKHVGMAFGVLPVSEINYGFDASANLTGFTAYPYTLQQSMITETTQYSGDGGIHEVFVGAGWEPFKGFSFGANVMYMWGSLDRQLYLYYSDSAIKQLYKHWIQDVSHFRFNVGVQYSYDLGKGRSLTAGLTYTPETGFGNNATKMLVNYGTAETADTTNFTASGGYKIPAEIAFGLAYRHSNKWKIGIDYSLQKWGSLDNTPFKDDKSNKTEGSLGKYDDRHKIAVGGEWCPNPMGRSYFSHIKLRGGFSYTSPYLHLNTMYGEFKGPKEVSATIGFALPIINNYNNRSVLNIGFQWVNESGSLIKENTFRINVALTFNERWFAKWKFE